MGFSRQEYWSALPFPPPGDLPDPGIEEHGGLQSMSHKELDMTEQLMYNTGNYIQHPVINQNGKEYEKECIYIYVCECVHVRVCVCVYMYN